jgi:hypothetical protein
MLIYAGSKITLAVDMPDEYPVMMFNEATMKQGSFQISGTKESEVYTGIDINYIDPTNHFKRETVRVNTADANDGTDTSDIENITSLDYCTVFVLNKNFSNKFKFQVQRNKSFRNQSIYFYTNTKPQHNMSHAIKRFAICSRTGQLSSNNCFDLLTKNH